MEFRRHRSPQVQLNIAPLVDLVFLLLIFVLLTSSFLHKEGIKVNLPAAKSSQMQDKEDITVSITKNNEIFLKGELVSLEELSRRLSEMMTKEPGKTVVIKADKNIVLEKAVKVLDTVKLAGATKIMVATEMELKKPGKR